MIQRVASESRAISKQQRKLICETLERCLELEEEMPGEDGRNRRFVRWAIVVDTTWYDDADEEPKRQLVGWSSDANGDFQLPVWEESGLFFDRLFNNDWEDADE